MVIASYPEKGSIHGPKTVGIASYTKNTLLSIVSICNKPKPKITVIAEKLNGAEDTYTDNGGIKVMRSWERNSIFYPLGILKTVAGFPETKKILFEFELSMFGNTGFLIFIPPLIFILKKIMGKHIILVSHQVVGDINLMSGHVNIKKHSIRAQFLNILIGRFYKVTYGMADKIIVFEKNLKDKLVKYTGERKITVIPHGIENAKNGISRNQARKKLGIRDEFVILYFGYLAWYKGTDLLVKNIMAFPDAVSGRKLKLIVAGGANPNHKDKEHYMDYVRRIENIASGSAGKIEVTGFIDEKDINKYFLACDLVVLPYRVLMSSSGPLSFASAYGKPFLISENIRNLIKTEDFKKITAQLDIKPDDVMFDFDKDGFKNKLKFLISNISYFQKLTRLSLNLREERSFDKIARVYVQEVLS